MALPCGLCGAGLAYELPRCRNARRRAVHLSEAAGALSGAWGASPARNCVCKVGVRESHSTRAQLPAPRWAPSSPHLPVRRPEQAIGLTTHQLTARHRSPKPCHPHLCIRIGTTKPQQPKTTETRITTWRTDIVSGVEQNPARCSGTAPPLARPGPKRIIL